jgi:hypothetical protein
MGKRIDDVRLFKQLVSEISIRRYEQVKFVERVEAIYEEIFSDFNKEASQPK